MRRALLHLREPRELGDYPLRIHRDVPMAAVATLVRSTYAAVLSWHRIGGQLLREHRWRIDIHLGVKAIIHDSDALAGE